MSISARARACLLFLALPLAALPSAQQSPPVQPPAQQPPAQPPQAQPPAQPPSGQQQPPIIRRGINYVRVDAIVADRSGKPVLDLTQDDFTVAEDGRPQKIESFAVVKIDEVAQAEGGPMRAIRSDYDEEREG